MADDLSTDASTTNSPGSKGGRPLTKWQKFCDNYSPPHLLAGIAMAAMESRLVFRPDAGGEKGTLLKPPTEYGLEGYQVRDLRLMTGETVTAWYKKASKRYNKTVNVDGNEKQVEVNYPTIVYCHGNSGSLDLRAPMLKEFSDRGFGVMVAAYPGFKGHVVRRHVEPSEVGCNATGYAMVHELLHKLKVPMEEISLFGGSLGGAVALRTAHNLEQGVEVPWGRTEPQKVPSVVCFNAFSSFPERARDAYPSLNAGGFMRNRFESDKVIPDVKAPVSIIWGKADRYTDPYHSQKLLQAAKTAGKENVDSIGLEGVTHSCSYTEEYQATELCKQMALLSDEQRHETAAAAGKLLKVRILPDKLGDASELLGAIRKSKKYENKPDQIAAFIKDLHGKDGGLSKDNPLKKYESIEESQDPDQIQKVVDCTQQHLNKLGLCDAPPERLFKDTPTGRDGMARQ